MLPVASRLAATPSGCMSAAIPYLLFGQLQYRFQRQPEGKHTHGEFCFQGGVLLPANGSPCNGNNLQNYQDDDVFNRETGEIKTSVSRLFGCERQCDGCCEKSL